MERPLQLFADDTGKLIAKDYLGNLVPIAAPTPAPTPGIGKFIILDEEGNLGYRIPGLSKVKFHRIASGPAWAKTSLRLLWVPPST